MLRSLVQITSVRSPAMQQTTMRAMSELKLFKLNELSHLPGSVKTKRRVGRGTGSGRGKLCGYGHQYSRSTPAGFEGGQTPLYKRLPKVGFHNPNEKTFTPVTLYKLQDYIQRGKMEVPEGKVLITMRDLMLAGIVSNIEDGVSLLATGKEVFKYPLHLEVSRASQAAIDAVEAAGGTVTCVHFNTLALRALLKPYKFDILPMRARPNPKTMQYYLDKTRCGYLSPEIQQRNLALFGHVTSEQMLRDEHDAFMAVRRKAWDAERAVKIEQLREKEAKLIAKKERKQLRLQQAEM